MVPLDEQHFKTMSQLFRIMICDAFVRQDMDLAELILTLEMSDRNCSLLDDMVAS